jgi:hypothetical protein
MVGFYTRDYNSGVLINFTFPWTKNGPPLLDLGLSNWTGCCRPQYKAHSMVFESWPSGSLCLGWQSVSRTRWKCYRDSCILVATLLITDVSKALTVFVFSRSRTQYPQDGQYVNLKHRNVLEIFLQLVSLIVLAVTKDVNKEVHLHHMIYFDFLRIFVFV